MQGAERASDPSGHASARGASSGADSGKGSVASEGGKGSVRMVGRGRSPNSESSTPSLMPPNPVVVSQVWSTDESSLDEAGDDRYLFADEKSSRRTSSGYMKRRRASRASSSGGFPVACAATEENGDFESAGDSRAPAPQARSQPRASLLESLSEGVANLWSREPKGAKTPPSRDSIQSTVLVTQDGEEKFLEEECHHQRKEDKSSIEDVQAHRGLFAAADLAQSLKRLSSDLSAGVVSMADSLRQAPPEARWTGASPITDDRTTLNLDSLMNEAHLPFRQLLQEVPDPENTPGGILASFPRLHRLQGVSQEFAARELAAAGGSLPDTGSNGRPAGIAEEAGVQSPLFSALVRARLAAHLIGCYEAVTHELTGEEHQLWDVFVSIDYSLAGSLTVSVETADEICNALAAVSTRAHAEACVKALAERVDESGECDFADLLDVWETEKRPDHLWQFRSSIRTGLSNLLAGAGISDPSPSRIPELRARCARLSDLGLAVAAAAYQRTLVLTCSWHCEQRLTSFLSSKESSSSRNVKVLLSVLRGIHSELVPTERVLWELMGKREKNFDGSVMKEEVLAALEELLSFHEEDSRASQGELEELDRLRRQCQKRSLQNLFADGRRSAVAFADVLRWWWDMPEEYREAAGLAVPASELRQRLRRQPEEMFRGPLRRVASEASFARQALRGHVRAFAELRALAVRRTIEGFSIRSTAESRTTTSDAGDVSYLSVDAEQLDEEAVILTQSPHSPHVLGPSAAHAEDVQHREVHP